MIVFCNSSDFINIFPSNTNVDFKLQLPQLVQFESNARVALLEIIVPPSEKSYIAHVFTNIISVCPIGSKSGRLLRIVSIGESKEYQHIQFASPIYHKLACSNIEEIQIYLETTEGKQLEFDKEKPTLAVLKIQ